MGLKFQKLYLNVIASCMVGSENSESFLILLDYKSSTPLTVSIMLSLYCISTGTSMTASCQLAFVEELLICEKLRNMVISSRIKCIKKHQKVMFLPAEQLTMKLVPPVMKSCCKMTGINKINFCTYSVWVSNYLESMTDIDNLFKNCFKNDLVKCKHCDFVKKCYCKM